MARKQVIPQHAEQVKIHETGARSEQERVVEEHFLEGEQFSRKFRLQALLLSRPGLNAAAAEFPFLVPQKTELVVLRHKLPPVNVVQLECQPFDVALNVPPDQCLQAVEFQGNRPNSSFASKYFA